MKAGTESDRAKSRSEALAKAIELEARGDKVQAQAFFARAVDVTPQMAFEVSEHLRSSGVGVIVAPYEADAQLGYLSRKNLVDVVISEDSDLVVFGCKRVLYKLDFKTERGKELVLDEIFSTSTFSRLSRESFLVTAILAGCDYLPSLQSIGMKTALALGAKAEALLSADAREQKGIDSDWFMDKLMMLIRLTGIDDLDIADDFKTLFRRAIHTFRHQIVFCPTNRCLLPLTPLDDPPSFLGEIYDPQTACLVADCMVHPETKEAFIPIISTENVDNIENVKIRKPRAKKIRTNSPKKPEARGSKLLDLWNINRREDKEEALREHSHQQPLAANQPELLDVSDEVFCCKQIEPRPLETECFESKTKMSQLRPTPTAGVFSLESLDSLRFTKS